MNACENCDHYRDCEKADERLPLWEKFVYIGFDFFKHNEQRAVLINRFTKQRKFIVEDQAWLNEYLNMEKQRYNEIRHFSNCGLAYARHIRLKDGIANIEIVLEKSKKPPK